MLDQKFVFCFLIFFKKDQTIAEHIRLKPASLDKNKASHKL